MQVLHELSQLGNLCLGINRQTCLDLEPVRNIVCDTDRHRGVKCLPFCYCHQH